VCRRNEVTVSRSDQFDSEEVAEVLNGAGVLALDSPHADRECLSGVGFGEVEEIAQDYNGALSWR
jgi:hypothetical protein